MANQQNNRDIWNYFQAQRTEAMAMSKVSITEANQAERDLSNQLILVATVVIAVTGALLAGGIFNNTITVAQGIAAFLAAAFALTAISCGIKYYFLIISFNEKWAITHQKIGLKFDSVSVAVAESDRDKYHQHLDEIQKLTNSHTKITNKLWLYTELVCLGIAFLALLVLVAAAVFDWHSIDIVKRLHMLSQHVEAIKMPAYDALLTIISISLAFIGSVIFSAGLLQTRAQIEDENKTYFDANPFTTEARLKYRRYNVIAFILIATGFAVDLGKEVASMSNLNLTGALIVSALASAAGYLTIYLIYRLNQAGYVQLKTRHHQKLFNNKILGLLGKYEAIIGQPNEIQLFTTYHVADIEMLRSKLNELDENATEKMHSIVDVLAKKKKAATFVAAVKAYNPEIK